jgi:hypothetical protein
VDLEAESLGRGSNSRKRNIPRLSTEAVTRAVRPAALPCRCPVHTPWPWPWLATKSVMVSVKGMRIYAKDGEARRGDTLAVKVWRTNGDAQDRVGRITDGHILPSRWALRIECPGERDDGDGRGEEAHSLQLLAELLEILMATATRALSGGYLGSHTSPRAGHRTLALRCCSSAWRRVVSEAMWGSTGVILQAHESVASRRERVGELNFA